MSVIVDGPTDPSGHDAAASPDLTVLTGDYTSGRKCHIALHVIALTAHTCRCCILMRPIYRFNFLFFSLPLCRSSHVSPD